MVDSIAEAIEQLANRDYGVRRQASGYLAARIDAATPSLLVLAQSDEHPQATEALRLLRLTDDDARVAVFEQAVQSNNPLIAQAALSGLDMMDAIPVDLLVEVLPQAHRTNIPHIVRLLGKSLTPDLIDTLVAYLQETEQTVIRYTIISVLETSGRRDLIPILEPYLQDEDRHVRNYAARAIATLGGPVE